MWQHQQLGLLGKFDLIKCIVEVKAEAVWRFRAKCVFMNEFESTFKAFLVLLTLGTPKTMYIMLFYSGRWVQTTCMN